MTRGVSVLTDYLFPLLLMGCGLLGLVVINLLSQQQQARAQKRAAPTQRVRTPQPGVLSGMKASPRVPRPVARARPRPVTAGVVARPRAVPIATGPALPASHRVSFGSKKKQADEGELERLSRFLKGASAGRAVQVTIHGWGKGRRKRRLARARARWVARQVGKLGLAGTRVATPRVSGDSEPAGAGEHTILIVVRKR